MNKIVVSILIVLLCASVVLSTIVYINRPQIAYVDLNQAFAEFNLKKELTMQFQQVSNKRQLVLDSLALRVDQFEVINADKKLGQELYNTYRIIKDDFLKKQQEFELSNSELEARYNDQIWVQINQYVDEFAEMNQFTVLLGGNGTGSIMYVDKSKDVTNELIEYLNKRYEGE